jgi:hypothetical protein
MGYAALLPKSFTLPVDPITTTFDTIAFNPNIVELLRGIAMKLHEFLTAKVALSYGLVLLSKPNVTVCGSGATDGLYHITL